MCYPKQEGSTPSPPTILFMIVKMVYHFFVSFCFLMHGVCENTVHTYESWMHVQCASRFEYVNILFYS